MNLLVFAIVLALICGVIEATVGIKDPWKKIVWFGVVALFVLGLLFILLPGFPYIRLDR